MKDRDKMKGKAKTKKDVYWKQYKHLRKKVTFKIRRIKKKYFIEKLGAKSAMNFPFPIDECKRVA